MHVCWCHPPKSSCYLPELIGVKIKRTFYPAWKGRHCKTLFFHWVIWQKVNLLLPKSIIITTATATTTTSIKQFEILLNTPTSPPHPNEIQWEYASLGNETLVNSYRNICPRRHGRVILSMLTRVKLWVDTREVRWRSANFWSQASILCVWQGRVWSRWQWWWWW